MSRTRLYAVIAVVAAALAGGLIFVYLARAGQSQDARVAEIRADLEAALGETQQVVIANEDIPPGTVLTAEMLGSALYVAASVPEGALTSLEEAVDAIALFPLFSGEPLITSRLSTDAESLISAAGAIPSNKLAYALPINANNAVGGAIAAGDIIELFGIDEEDQAQVIFDELKVLGIVGEYPFAGVPPGLLDEPARPQVGPSSKILILELTEREVLQLTEALATYQGVTVALHSSK